MGGFGNVLFQFMFGYSMARKYKMQLQFTTTEQKRVLPANYNSIKGFNFTNFYNSNKLIRMNETNHYYDTYNLNQLFDYYMNGYYQSYKYSKDYFEEIKKIILFMD